MRGVVLSCGRLVICLALLGATLGVLGSGVPAAQAVYPGKHITISVSRERLRAWVGHHVVLVTPVTTGNRALPTPTGYFTLYAKYSPYTMISPWPAGSADWYPPSRMSFAMEFARGYFIHDAPWRSVYGPGSNLGTQPGTNYGGTHGCVNVPYDAMKFLYNWAPNGTPVHIVG